MFCPELFKFIHYYMYFPCSNNNICGFLRIRSLIFRGHSKKDAKNECFFIIFSALLGECICTKKNGRKSVGNGKNEKKGKLPKTNQTFSYQNNELIIC